MAKGQKRGNREAKKPKQDKPKKTAAAAHVANIFQQSAAPKGRNSGKR